MQFDPPTTAKQVIESGRGFRLFKFGATWCKPCARILPEVHHLKTTLDPGVVFMEVDIDEDGDVFMALKSKRIVSGIPALVYYPDGISNMYSPTAVVCGSDVVGIRAIFDQVNKAFRQHSSDELIFE
jgi:thiol-disulfide isomerase/thioredoxin